MTNSLQVPNCFTWNHKPNNNITNETGGSVSKFAEKLTKLKAPDPELKYVYDKNRNDTLDLYVICNTLEIVFHLGATDDTTVRDLKEHIKRLQDIPIDFLLVSFRGVLLSNSLKLKDCGVTHRDNLGLKIKLHTAICEKCGLASDKENHGIKLTLVSITGRAFEAEVPVLNTIDALKELVEKAFNSRRNEVLLLYNGINLIDDKSFEEYGITSQKNILLIFYQYENCGFCGGCAKAATRPTVALYYLNCIFVCLLQPHQSVRSFKEICYRYLNHIHPDLQSVFYKTQELDDKKMMSDYEIKDGDDLFVKINFKLRTCDNCKGPLS